MSEPKRKLILMKGQDPKIDKLMEDLDKQHKDATAQLEFFEKKVNQIAKAANKQRKAVWDEVEDHLKDTDKLTMDYDSTGNESLQWDDENGILWRVQKNKDDFGNFLKTLLKGPN